MSTHLVIGASGLVGGHLMNAITQAGHDAIGTYYKHPVDGMRQLDIRDYDDVVWVARKISPAIIYLPAAVSNVDYCELQPYDAYMVNVMGVHNVVQSALVVGAKLVYFSSDYIFDGKSGPYYERSVANPVCEYGWQKVLAEHYVMSCMLDYLIIRTTVVYGWERQDKNFICGLVKTLGEGRIFKVPMDQIGSPTYAPNLARAVVQLATVACARRIYHVAGPKRVDRYEFAREAARVFGLDSDLIQPVVTSDLGQTAERPLNCGMVVKKAEANLTFPLLNYHEGLKEMRGIWT